MLQCRVNIEIYIKSSKQQLRDSTNQLLTTFQLYLIGGKALSLPRPQVQGFRLTRDDSALKLMKSTPILALQNQLLKRGGLRNCSLPPLGSQLPPLSREHAGCVLIWMLAAISQEICQAKAPESRLQAKYAVQTCLKRQE